MSGYLIRTKPGTTDIETLAADVRYTLPDAKDGEVVFHWTLRQALTGKGIESCLTGYVTLSRHGRGKKPRINAKRSVLKAACPVSFRHGLVSLLNPEAPKIEEVVDGGRYLRTRGTDGALRLVSAEQYIGTHLEKWPQRFLRLDAEKMRFLQNLFRLE